MVMAYFLLLILTPSEWPMLFGPYEAMSQCLDVQEFVERRGYEKGQCELLPLPQEASSLAVGFLPDATGSTLGPDPTP